MLYSNYIILLLFFSANEATVNAINAVRQHGVNNKALHYGAGVGTAHYYGVPGTVVRGVHSGAYHGAYNNGAYGYGHNSAYNGAHTYGHNGAYNTYPHAAH